MFIGGRMAAMKFIQYYLDCLSHASYLIGDETTGRAVVVDPQRDVSEYLADAQAFGFTVELVIETHFHADFLSGHLELANATGATIVYSSVAEPEFNFMGVDDGQRYSLGEVTLEFRHTPGHTPESLSMVVYEHPDDQVPYGVLTGDTLFVGDVGRPDLLASIGFTRDELADKLYDSLHNKLMTLPDATRVYPAHGAGSACGENPAPAASYFAYDAILNRKERGVLDENAMPPAMTYDQVLDAIERGAVLVDGRPRRSLPDGICATPSTSGSTAAMRNSAAQSSRPTSTLWCSLRSRTRGQEPSRSHWIRPSDRLPRRAGHGDARAPRGRSLRIAVDGQGVRQSGSGSGRSPAC